MAKPTINMPSEDLERFDETVDDLKRASLLEMRTGRSEIVRDLMMEWAAEQRERLDEKEG